MEIYKLFFQMEQNIKENTIKNKEKEKAHKSFQMEENMKEIGRKTREMDLEHIFIQTEEYIKDNVNIIKKME
jgi:hypothetical protein